MRWQRRGRRRLRSSAHFFYGPTNVVRADFSPGGYGQGLTLTLDNGWSPSVCGDTVNGCGAGTLVPDGTFFGVITSPTFTTLTITAGGLSGSAETFDLSNLDMVHNNIPEPATILLLGAGLLGFSLLRKARAEGRIGTPAIRALSV